MFLGVGLGQQTTVTEGSSPLGFLHTLCSCNKAPSKHKQLYDLINITTIVIYVSLCLDYLDIENKNLSIDNHHHTTGPDCI